MLKKTFAAQQQHFTSTIFQSKKKSNKMQNLDSTISAGVAGTAITAATQTALPPAGEPLALTIFRLLLPSLVSILTYFLHSKMKNNQPNNQ